MTVIRKWDFCGEDTVSDNDTSGKADPVWKDGEIPMKLLPDGCLWDCYKLGKERKNAKTYYK